MTIPELIDGAKVVLGKQGELVPAGELAPYIPEDRQQEFWSYIIDKWAKANGLRMDDE